MAVQFLSERYKFHFVMFPLYMDVPVNKPLTRRDLLQMQWILHRIAVPSGSDEVRALSKRNM